MHCRQFTDPVEMEEWALRNDMVERGRRLREAAARKERETISADALEDYRRTMASLAR